eukprot:scpid12850/ scgid14118/ Serine/threonine-protein kinase CTR1
MLVMKLNTRQSCASVGECRCQGQRSSQATLPSLVHVAIYSAILLLSCFAATLAVGSEGDSVARPAPASSAKHIVEIIRRSGAVVGRTAVDDRVHLSLSKPSNIPAETEKTVPATGDTRRSRRGKTREAATSGDFPAADHGMAHSDLIDNFLSAILHSTLTRGAEYTRALHRETHDTWPQASRSSRPVPWSTPEAQQKWNAVEDNSSDIQVPPLLEVQCTKAYSPTLRTLHPNDISSISHPMLVREPLVIQEHAMTDEYHAMLLLSVPASYNDTFPVSVTHLSVYLFEVEGERGQTWRIHDRIDISFLPESCRNPRNVIGTVVASTSRKFVFIYGYGARLECNQTIVYNPSKRRHRLVRIVSASGRGPERKRTAALSSHSAQPLILGGTAAMLAIRDITNPNGTESILMFGGTGCEFSNIFAEHCQQFSNDVHVLQLSGDNFEIGSWTTRVSNSGVLHPCPTPRIASLLLNADASDGPTLFVYGGMSLSSSGGTETGRYPLEAECDLWQFHASRREWTKLTHLKENCEARAASSCFAWNRLPLRPFGAYSQGAGELAIVNIAFSDGAVPLACFESSLSISRITIRGTRTGNWSTVKQTTTTNFAPELMQDVSRIRALGFLYHNTSLFMVQTSLPFTVNLSVEFDYVTGQPSVAWRALPGEDPMYSFPGNVGCITMQTPIYFRPRPHEEGDESFGEPYAAMIGGFCMFPRYAYSRRAEGDTWPEPSWKSLPIWSYSSHAHEYTMRVIKPGPPFADRFCHSLLQLFDSTRPKAVIYGGLPLTGAPPDRHVWCFDWLDQYWRIGNLTNRHQTPERSGFAGIGHSAVTLSNTSFLLYGGMEWDPITGVLALALNQAYVFTFSDLSTCTGSWRQVSTARPMPRRMLHTATVHDGKVIVGGGFTSHFQPVNHALLSLTIVVSRSRVTVDWTPIPLLPTLLDSTMYSLASFSKSTLLIMGGVKIKCLYNYMYKDHRAKKCLSIPSYLVPLPAPLSDLRNMTTLRHTNVIPFFSSYPMVGHSVVGSVVYGGILLPFPNLANPQSAVFSDKTCHYNMAPHHCPLGHGWVNDSCKACDVNFYSSDLSGICTECGPYLITNSTASKECSALDPCYKDFCHGHGECLVNHRKATCSCNWGYLSYDNCQLPLVIILIVTGTVILALIILFVWRRVRQSQKLFRQREQDLQVSRWQLRQLANGVLVKWREIEPSIKRIIGSGSSGDVFLAELSDIPVAVKVLRRGRMDDVFLQQFIRELDLMRTVRHPNIVIFLGAGTKPPQRSPFIVMEYVMRESLFKILSEHAPHAISCQRKIDFATDIASGMEFLHSSEPPRIHCDLKSSNLLVTSKWKVKIADFGMLRLLSTIDFYGRMDPEENLVANTAACAPGFNHVTMPIPRPFTATPDGPEEEHDTKPLLTCAQRAEHSDLQPQVVADCRNHAATTSMRVEGTAGLTQAMGTSRWCSPETLTDGVFDEYTDVYSYGVVLWEILTHDKPYNEQDDENDVIRGIKNGERLPLPPGQELYELKRITEDCWSKEAKSRPLFPEILGRLNLAR